MKLDEITFQWLVIFSLLGSLSPLTPASAQPITPAADGTNTVVTPEGDRLDISGGSLSQDGANLFHSFQQFGLSQGQIANFLSNPEIRNILGRVVGGDASYINGLIQITGGNSNLFLMNPAGILFGANAQLNVMGDFTATTATAIGLGESWFNGFGDNNYAALVGTPSAFNFSISQPGSIVNLGNLSLEPGQNLTLLGGNVLNIGTLSSPGGTITLAAVPGESLVRISQAGHLLSLEVSNAQSDPTSLMPVSLPELLTGGGTTHANQVQVNPDGTIALTSSGPAIPMTGGTAIASGTLDVSGETGGTVQVLGEKVGAIASEINASGIQGGGTILLGGEYRGQGPIPTALYTFVSSDSTLNTDAGTVGDGGRVILWADDTTRFDGHITARGGAAGGNGGFVEVSGKQNLIFRGNVDVSAPNGNLGSLLLDPENIIIVDGNGGAEDSELDDSNIFSLEGTGDFTISEQKLESLEGNADITLEASNDITIEDLSDNELTFKSGEGAITFNADADRDGSGSFSMNEGDSILAGKRAVTIYGVSITAGTIRTEDWATGQDGPGGNVTLTAQESIDISRIRSMSANGDAGDIILELTETGGTIVTGNLEAYTYYNGDGGTVDINANGGDIQTGHIETFANVPLSESQGGADIIITGGNISVGDLNAGNQGVDDAKYGGSITISGAGNISTGSINSAGNLIGGNIRLTATAGTVSVGNLQSQSNAGDAGDVTLTALGDIVTSEISSYGQNLGGHINITSEWGAIDTTAGTISSYTTGHSYEYGIGGNITIVAPGDITTGNIRSSGWVNGGEITITSDYGVIDTTWGTLSSYTTGSMGAGGDISLAAQGDITTSDIESYGSNIGGKIKIISSNGLIDTTLGTLSSYNNGPGGTGGTITLESEYNVTTSDIESYGSNIGGDINIISNSGAIDTRAGSLNSFNSSEDGGIGGNITLEALGDIASGNIESYGSDGGGSIAIRSHDGAIDTSAAPLISNSTRGDAGDVTLQAEGNILTNYIRSWTFGDETKKGGNISITSNSGAIDTTAGGTLLSEAIIAPNAAIAEISNSFSSQFANLDAYATNGTGGNITLSAANGITTSHISSFGAANSGNVNLNSSLGDITTNVIFSVSANGNGGSITLNVPQGNISSNHLASYAAQQGGAINITSGGTLNLGEATLNSYSSAGAAGDVTIAVGNSLILGGDASRSAIRSEGYTQGGNITVNSSEGAIAAPGSLDSFSETGTAGTLSLVANTDITTNGIRSEGAQQGGSIAITSTTGAIDASGGGLNSYSSGGTAGNVTLTAPGNITTSTIRSEGYTEGGDITITSNTGAIATDGSLNSYSETGTAGNVALTANTDITTVDISSQGGEQGGSITLTSNAGEIDTSLAALTSTSDQGNAGNVTLEAAGNIVTNYIQSWTFGDETKKGGNISITSNSGAIDTTAGGTLLSEAIIAPNAAIAEISNSFASQFANLDAYATNGTGGNITLSAANGITTSHISSFGAANSGNVNLNSSLGDITTNVIFSVSANGNGGSITLNVPQGNINSNHLASYAAQQGGAINITSGGTLNLGEATLNSYSSAGAAGDVTIAVGNSLILGGDASRSAIRSEGYTQGGNITVNSSEGAIAAPGSLDSFSETGTAGTLSLVANTDITTNGIRSEGAQQGGSIAITSTTGAIDASGGGLNSYSSGGTAGNVTLTAPGNIITSTIRSEGYTEGGDITINSNTGAIATDGSLNSYSETGTAGTVNLSAHADITTNGIRSEGAQQGGSISLESTTGVVDASGGNLDSYSRDGNAGQITVTAEGDIKTGFIRSFTLDDASTSLGGEISLISRSGAINTTAGDLSGEAEIALDGDVSSPEVANAFQHNQANINAYSANGTAGNITLNARNQITTSHISSYAGEGSGNVTLGNSIGDITTGVMFSSTRNGGGGAIAIQAPEGNINIDHIATYSSNGTGGNVNLSASGSVTLNNIASFGNLESGDVTIISDASTITTGAIQTLAPSGTSGNITLNTFSTSGNIQTAELRSSGAEGAGDITVIAEDGSVLTGDIESTSETGDSGNIIVEGSGDVQTGDIRSEGGQNSGDIAVNSSEGSVTTGNIETIAHNGDSGNIAVNAEKDVITGDIRSEASQNSGNIEVNSNSGSVTTGNIETIAHTGDSGNIAVNAEKDILTGDIRSIGGNNSGNIQIESRRGTITTGNIESIAGTGTAGDISLYAEGEINTGNVTSTGALGGGNIELNSKTGEVNTGTVVTNGGQLDISEGSAIAPTEAVRAFVAPRIEQSNVLPPAQQGGNPTATEPRNPVLTVDPGMNLSLVQQNTELQQVLSRTGDSLAITSIGNSDLIELQGLQNNSTLNSMMQAIGISDLKSVTDSISDRTSTTQQIAHALNAITSNPLTVAGGDAVASLEQSRDDEYSEYFGTNFSEGLMNSASLKDALVKITAETGYHFAVVYISALPSQLELILFTADGQPIRKTIPEAPREQLLEVVQQFRSELTNPRRLNSKSYLKSAQQLYNWLIAPIASDLEAAGINTLMFSMDAGLRSLPVAALHDGEQFLVEKYSLSQIPSVSLIDTTYRPLQDTRVLAMGASTFTELSPLPAVPVELTTIADGLWEGEAFINEQFTRENLLQQRQSYPYPIIHLATHGEFKSGSPSESYIQLWDDQLQLDRIREMGWNNPVVELLVLSACRTALGDERAELGFAGLAVQAGVKSALASLWYVSDEGTLALMTEFYTHLTDAKIKAEALREAQIAMIRGEVRMEGGQLLGTGTRGGVTLPSGLQNQRLSFAHPYFWSSFTLIGSPW
ncbi:CHAT domain-containing protein [Laspinema olomoucense]|uniref:CHAT domain-containing protein n=2 Tax=Laspinema TaxID=2584823 RepID=A0ABT2NBD8_9CYAN|nr:CHAT domain-containing protein [Laspinema sp. D3b]MCT7980021.1 CHAT domain-containing protein [Laspinema sp. D3b]